MIIGPTLPPCRRVARLLSLGCALVMAACPAQAKTAVFHAASPGQQTLDQGEGGGNPFASSLIEILKQDAVNLPELSTRLRSLTIKKSAGFQVPDVPDPQSLEPWSLVPARPKERRRALVLVVSDYARSGGAQSLPGAKRDGLRVSKALTEAGFTTDLALDLGVDAFKARLAAFKAQTAHDDVAVIYTTGHGVEIDGQVFLLPADYPVSERAAALSTRAIALAEVAASLQAHKINLVFYGGCRNQPWAK